MEILQILRVHLKVGVLRFIRLEKFINGEINNRAITLKRKRKLKQSLSGDNISVQIQNIQVIMVSYNFSQNVQLSWLVKIP